MKVLKILALIIIIGVPLLLAVHFMREFLLVDRCLDSGGSFDYVRMVCDREESHPYIPYVERYAKSMMAGLIAILIAATCLIVMKTKQWS